MVKTLFPKVSVVIPLYNKAPFIERALHSVLSQTIQDFEIIVVNDGSQDGGEILVRDFKDSRILLINQKNQGVSAARNHGIDVARSELVAFLDADDEWLPDFLETILRMREKWPDAGMYSTTWYYQDEKSNTRTLRKTPKVPTNWEGIVPSTLESAAYALDNSFPGCASSIAVPRKIFCEVGKFNEDAIIWEDPDMWGKIALFYPCAHTTIPHAIYYRNETSITANTINPWGNQDPPFIKSYKCILENRGMYQKFYEDSKHISLYLDRIYLNMTRLELLAKNKLNARNNLGKIESKSFYLEIKLYAILSYLPKPILSIVLNWVIVLAKLLRKFRGYLNCK